MKTLLVSSLALVCLALAAGCRARAAPALAPDAAEEVLVPRERLDRGEARLVEVREGEVPRRVAAAGRVAFEDERLEHVLSPVAGEVRRTLAGLGDRIRPGSPLVVIASPEVGSAAADLAKAEADDVQAKADLVRQQKLSGLGAATRRDLEAAEDAARRASAERARARERMALLRRADLDAQDQELTLRSAIAGEVVARSVSPGVQVQGSSSGGTPTELFTIGDIDQVWILADVPEADLPRVRKGAAAEVRVAAWPGRAFHGTVDLVGGALDPALRTARVRIPLDNPDHALRPEMLAQVAIAAQPRRALVAPAEALTTLDGQSFALVGGDEGGDGRLRFQRRRVRASVVEGTGLAVVEQGLAAGERILLDARAEAAAPDEVRVTREQFQRSGMRVAAPGAPTEGETIVAGGRLTFDDARVAHVFAPVTGRVVRLRAEPGQRVKKGAPLLAMVSQDVGSAFADAVKAEADLTAAEHERQRQRELVAAHAGAPRDLEAAEGACQKARAELERARQKTRLLSGASWDAVTQELTLRSPIEGEVVGRAATPGLEVQGQWNGAGNPVELLTVGSLERLWVLGDAFEIDLPELRVGEEVAIRVPALPDRTFHGRIDWVASALDPTTRTARFRCAIDNPDHALRPEMAPVLSIALPARPHPTVPRSAVLRLGADRVIFAATGERDGGQLSFRPRRVTLGEELPDGTVPVLSGLDPDQRVVVAGAIYLSGLL
jgi:cobalt-zinc-cadmium efflux system membrane fusion protein